MTPAEIHAARAKFGLSQSDFGAAIGLAVRTIRRAESGEQPLSVPAEHLIRLALISPQARKYLGLTLTAPPHERGPGRPSHHTIAEAPTDRPLDGGTRR
jgi:transcriptional regulator with XRE-family HTH domain